mgnify:CR=1 FL=1
MVEEKQEENKELSKKQVAESAAEDLIRRTNEAAARLEVANKKFAEHRAFEEAARVDKILQGEAETNVSKREESPKEYKDRVMRGEL